MKQDAPGQPRRKPLELQRFRIFERLPVDVLSEITKSLRDQPTPYTTRTALNGDVLLVWSGRFHLLFDIDASKPVVLRTLGPGDHIGDLAALFDGGGPAYVVEMVDPGELLALPGQDFRRLLNESPAFQQAALEELARSAIRNADRLFELTMLSERERLALQLSHLATQGTNGQMPDGWHAVLAAQIGSTESGVIDLLSELQAEGLIDYAGEQISILQPARFERDRANAARRLSERWRSNHS